MTVFIAHLGSFLQKVNDALADGQNSRKNIKHIPFCILYLQLISLSTKLILDLSSHIYPVKTKAMTANWNTFPTACHIYSLLAVLACETSKLILDIGSQIAGYDHEFTNSW